MKLSLCIITKNEEKNIATCINSVKEIIDEIIVVDTGSTDNTVQIVEELGGVVYHFEWIQDFAAARNYALSKATGDWIIFLDADEYMSKQSIPVLRAIVQKAHKLNCDVVQGELINIDQVTQAFQSAVPNIRILKRSPLIGYRGRIHEMIHKIKGTIKKLDACNQIKIFHVGYSRNIVQEKKKSERNVELLYKQLDENPNSSNIHFYLVEGFNLDGNTEKVFYHAKEVFKYHNGSLTGIYQKSYFYQLESMIKLKHTENEIVDLYSKAVQFDKTYPDYEVVMGNYYAEKAEYRKAINHFSQGIVKMNAYQGEIESWAISNAKQVFKVMANLHLLLREYDECVKYYVYLLNVYKDDQETLVRLIQVLKVENSLEQIFNMLSKIYDMANEKDKLIVLKACVALKDPKVSAFLKELLDSQAQTQ